MKEFGEVVKSILDSKLFIIVATVAVAWLLMRIVKKIFVRVRARNTSVYLSFLQSMIKALIVVFAAIRIIGLSASADRFYQTMVLSSSVIVVVLGFIFQEGTKNIIHGFFISMYNPFKVGDRIHVVVDGKDITGYVEEMTLRHTTVRNAFTNAKEVIPNSVLDGLNIENFSSPDTLNTRWFTVEITYESDVEKAKQILAEIVAGEPEYVDTREKKGGPLTVSIADLGAHGIDLGITVTARTEELLYTELSDIREQLLRQYTAAGIDIAYEHLQLLGDVTVKNS